MSDRLLTDVEKFAEIDRLITQLVTADRMAPNTLTLRVLKSIALDLQAQPGKAPRVLEALDFQVRSALRCKARLGYIEQSNHQAVSESLLGHWPVVRKALEKFGEET